MTSNVLSSDRNSQTRPSVPQRPLRWLFVKERFSWPRSSGHDVHTFGMMHGLEQLGHNVAVVTVDPAPEMAFAGLHLSARYCLNEAHPPVPQEGSFPTHFSRSQEKFRSYWGINPERVQQVAAAAADHQADIVVVSGLNVLPYLGAIQNRVRIWYAADEWVWHHLSLFRMFRRSTWSEVRPAVIKGFYERAYRSMLERVWVVTDSDARAFRWFAGIRSLDVIPNGVDAEYYHPETVQQIPNSCVFWGRLDFGPNIQALEWFCQKVWPRVREKIPDARFRVFGFQPSRTIETLCQGNGVELKADLPDLRPVVRESQVAVMPFVSGGGIKNKLLEAAALGMPIVCSRRACQGLKGDFPFQPSDDPRAWARSLIELWANAERRKSEGALARKWVIEHHTWVAAARTAADGIAHLVHGGTS